ncbi:hypothetical protein ACHHYP_05427 [Achlya hypogyna]|uniref:EF-hand domain-containing protein n=1 Tax=Achlya hypogyna TaxID=1202772 RepID=A0A1V9ZNR5_ACHHY|nr:hypothetical protein ACHHYP_05427 [Achlya hypogyna]
MATKTTPSCLDVMMRLRIEDLADLKADFDAHEGGLDLRTFVSLLLDRLEWTDTTVVALVHELTELFDTIAIIRHGVMEWEDFTNAIIDAGMSTSAEELAWRDLRYEENAAFVDTSSRQPRHIEYIPELKRLFVFEGTRPVLQVYDPAAILALETGVDDHDPSTAAMTTLPLLHEVHPLCYQPGYRRDQDEVRSERSPVQVIKYLSGLDILVVAAGDLKLTFWSPNVLLTGDAPEPIHVATIDHPARVLEWAPIPSHLFSVATDHTILVWTITMKRKKSCGAQRTGVLRRHRDIVQDVLLVNEDTFVSCAMDSLILVWDPTTLELKSTRRGHTRGVRKLVKHSDTVFVSSGFEMDMLGWDVSGLSIAPIFRLPGHVAPIRSVHMIPHLGQAISLDEEGYFKWWNLNNLVAMDDNDRCLQTFRFGNDQYPWKPNAFTLFANGATILATGFHMKWIHRIRLKPKHFASNAALFNRTTCTLLTTTDRDIHISSATTGALLHVFRGLCRTDITHVVLDARHRKFIAATIGGDVVVCNYETGALLKTFPRHHAQVSCMIYCNEDACVLTASWDRSLRLYDDDSPKPLLRCITDAHDSDIKCLAYSYHLGLVATGAADGSLKIWDYVYFLLEQRYRDYCIDVTAVAFLDPHPIVIAGYDNGVLVMYSVRPVDTPTRLCHFSTDVNSPTASVTTLQVLYDAFGGAMVAEGIASGQQLVFAGDQNGMLRCWDVYPLLRQYDIGAADERKLPHTSKSYNPRRRIEREGKSTLRTPEDAESTPETPEEFGQQPPLVAAWQAHQMGIKRCTIVEAPVMCLLTCSFDKSTKVWALDGTLLGVLGGAWQLSIDVSESTTIKWAQATALWNELKTTKLDKSTNRRLERHRSMPSLASLGSLASLELPTSLRTPPPSTEKERLFGQLHGDMTWKKSDIQMARELAWDAEAEKYKARMIRIFRQKQTKKQPDDLGEILGSATAGPHVLESLASDHRSETPLATMLPRLTSNQLSQMNFDDKDNWSVNSLNRQKLSYHHLYTENTRNQRNGQNKKQPKLLLETIDTSPSAFLLQHLGPEAPRKPTPKVRLKHPPTLAPSASAPTLLERDKPRRLSSLRLEKMQNSAQATSLNGIINAAASTLASKATPKPQTTTSPLKTLERYATLFGAPVPQPKAKPSPEKPPRKPLAAAAHVVLPAMVPKAARPPLPGSVREMVEADRKLLHQPFFGPYPRDHVLEVCKIFVRIDVDNSGVIETAEFVDKLSQLQNDDWRDALHTVFNELDRDHNGQLDMPELLKAMFPKATVRVRDEMLQFAKIAVAAERHEKAKVRELSPQALADITALFHLFDVDNSGAIEPMELLRQFRTNEKLFYSRSPDRFGKWQLEDIVQIFQQYDSNANASLELDEFIELFRDSF